MAGYQHVLFATDLTDAALRAGQRAAEQARFGGGRLTLLHVVEHFPEDLSVGSPPVGDEDPEAFVRRRADERLVALADALGIDAERRTVVSRYSARQAILEFAGHEAVDLIVMGVIGHPGQLGTTVDGVAASAPCDVLVIQGAGWEPG